MFRTERLLERYAIPVTIIVVNPSIGLGVFQANLAHILPVLVHHIGNIHPFFCHLIKIGNRTAFWKFDSSAICPPHYLHTVNFLKFIPCQIHIDRMLLFPRVPIYFFALSQLSVIDHGFSGVQAGMNTCGRSCIQRNVLSNANLIGHLCTKGFPLTDAHAVAATSASLDIHTQGCGSNGLRKLHCIPQFIVAVNPVVGACVILYSHI